MRAGPVVDGRLPVTVKEHLGSHDKYNDFVLNLHEFAIKDNNYRMVWKVKAFE